MAIEIIKRGTPPGDRRRQVSCQGCHSILSVTAKDGVFVFDFRDGDFYRFKCPVCEAEIIVNASKL